MFDPRPAWRSPVAKYYAYVLTTYVSFSAPIWILYVRAQGLTFAQVGLLNSVWWAGLVLFEVPTGYVGDRLGRRNAMLVGTAVVACMTAAMGLSDTALELAVVYGTWALGQTFRSGSGDAWLYDLLAETEESATFTTVRGRAHGLGLAVGAVTALFGGVVADVNLSYPFFATSVVTAIGIPVLLTVPTVSGRSESRPFAVRDAVVVLRERLAQPPLRAFVGYFALLFGFLGMVYIFDQPVTLDAATRLGVPVTAGKTAVGAVYAGFTLVAAAGSYNADRIRRHVGLRRWFLVAPALVAVAFLGVGLATWSGHDAALLAVPVFFVARAVNTASTTLGKQYINDHVESFGRATTLSAASMVNSLAIIPFEVAGGVVADAFSPLVALAAFGLVFLVVGGGVWVVGRPLTATGVGSADRSPEGP